MKPTIYYIITEYAIIDTPRQLNLLDNELLPSSSSWLNISLNEFNEYEVIISKHEVEWYVNDIKIMNMSLSTLLSRSYWAQINALVISIEVDEKEFSRNILENSCPAMFIDFIYWVHHKNIWNPMYNISQPFEKVSRNITKVNRDKLCEQTKAFTKNWILEFVPNKNYKDVIFNSTFINESINDNWIIDGSFLNKGKIKGPAWSE